MVRERPWSRDDFGLFRRLPAAMPEKDNQGHLNNAAHGSLFDIAVNGWLIEEELLDPKGRGPVGLVVETSCSYFSELAFADKVVAGIRVAHVGTSSVRYEIALFRGEEERCVAQGRFVHVYVDPASRKPQPLSQAFRVKLEDYIK